HRVVQTAELDADDVAVPDFRVGDASDIGGDVRRASAAVLDESSVGRSWQTLRAPVRRVIPGAVADILIKGGGPRRQSTTQIRRHNNRCTTRFPTDAHTHS